jgi:hypothetical protein
VNVHIMPRWAGGAEDDWYPWLRDSLPDHAVSVAPLRPSPEAPTIEACVEELARGLANRDLSSTVLVGHSVGCQAQLRYLASLGEPATVAGLLCVAGWWSVDEPWDTIRPWIETPLDRQAVRRAAPRIRVVLSDNDPFTSDHAGNAATWRERLGAEVTVVPAAKHFNGAGEPAVLAALRELLG